MFAYFLNLESQRLNLFHLNNQQIQNDISHLFHNMKHNTVIYLLLLLFTIVYSISPPTYTIHYLKSYRGDLIQKNFGCGQSVVYGTFLLPIGAVDALYVLLNGNVFGFNSHCPRKDSYVKIFGDAQDYQILLNANPNMIEQIVNTLNRANTKKIIVDWKYLPQQNMREKARQILQKITSQLKGKGFEIYVKAPASYFCLDIIGKKYILDLSINNFIVQLYGQEPGKYTTYESIFGNEQQPATNGYTTVCPQYPTRADLVKNAPTKKIYFEKTVNTYESGYIGPKWKQFLEKAGEEQFNSIYFLDGYPEQTVDL